MVNMSRRELAGSLTAGALLQAAAVPATYVVIGAGVFGAWTAYHLRRAGHTVTLLDQYGPASSRASSGGESRIIRAAYGPDEVYTRMAMRSLGLWSAFFVRSGVDLLHRTGVLWMAKRENTYSQQSRETLRKVGVPFEDLSNAEMKRRYPQIRAGADVEAILEANSGALMAREAVAAVVEQFVRDGGTYQHAAVRPPQGSGTLREVITSEGESIVGDAYVFACGPWLGKVFPEALGPRIFVTRQDVLFFGVPAGDRRFEPPRMPIWIDFSDGRGMYGFPDLARRGFKVAFDLHGAPFDPDNGNRFVAAEKAAQAREYVKERFPALADSPIIESRVCQYENTSNGDFVIDRHPEFENVWIAGGGSGHGFKHGPAVGEYTAARVTGAATPAVEPRFSMTSKKTEQKRAVY
jgi:sarcosine oxidase